MRKLTHVLGVPFDAVTMEEAVARAKKLLQEEGQHIICTPNPEIVMEAQKDQGLMNKAAAYIHFFFLKILFPKSIYVCV